MTALPFKSLGALLLATTALSAAAAASTTNYYIVVPVLGKRAPAPVISVALAQATLPPGMVATLYPPFDLKPSLSVTGDGNFDAAQVAWGVTSGALPEGLHLDAGVLSGTPTVPTARADFTVQASYKTKTGQQAYSIVVAGAPTGLGDGVSKVGACASGEATGCATFAVAGSSQVTLSANLLVSTSVSYHSLSPLTTCKSAGKWYWEFTELADGVYPHSGYGLMPANVGASSNYPGLVTGGWALNGIANGVNGIPPSGQNQTIGSLPGGLTTGQTVGIAMDLDGRTAKFITAQGVLATVPLLSTGAYCGVAGYMHLAKYAVNSGQSTFVNPVPAGFNRGLW